MLSTAFLTKGAIKMAKKLDNAIQPIPHKKSHLYLIKYLFKYLSSRMVCAKEYIPL